jgi:hypothetical protein
LCHRHDDRAIKQRVLVKLHHRAGENGIDAAVGLSSPKRTINARVVDFATAVLILVDRQFLPWAAQIEQLQNVVEDLEQTALRCRAAATDGQGRQDKLFKQSDPQLRGNRLPTTASSHSSPPENRILPDPGTVAENPASRRLSGKFGGPEKPATSCRTPH